MHKLKYFKCLKVCFDIFDFCCMLYCQTSSAWLIFSYSANPARWWQFRLFMLWSPLRKTLDLYLPFTPLSPSWAQWQESWSWEFNKLFCHGTVMVIFTLLKNVYFGILTTWYWVALSILSWTGSSETAQQGPWVTACGSGRTKVPL